MTKIWVGQQEFAIEFRHATKRSGVVGSKIGATAITTCVVIGLQDLEDRQETTEPSIIVIESAICSPEDQFSRHEGRLRSLAKCLSRCRQLRAIQLEFSAAYCAATHDDLATLVDFIPGRNGTGDYIQSLALRGKLKFA